MPELACTDFDKLLAEKKKLLVVFIQPGCPICPPYIEAVAQAQPKLQDVDIAELPIGTGEDSCEDLADRFKVGVTPTALYFREGKLERTLLPSGDSQKDLEALLSLASGESEPLHKPAEVSPSSPEEAPAPAP